MRCNCKVTEIILGAIILIFAFLWASGSYNRLSAWVIIIAAIALILHAFMHHKDHGMHKEEMMEKMSKSSRKKR